MLDQKTSVQWFIRFYILKTIPICSFLYNITINNKQNTTIPWVHGYCR